MAIYQPSLFPEPPGFLPGYTSASQGAFDLYPWATQTALNPAPSVMQANPIRYSWPSSQLALNPANSIPLGPVTETLPLGAGTVPDYMALPRGYSTASYAPRSFGQMRAAAGLGDFATVSRGMDPIVMGQSAGGRSAARLSGLAGPEVPVSIRGGVGGPVFVDRFAGLGSTLDDLAASVPRSSTAFNRYLPTISRWTGPDAVRPNIRNLPFAGRLPRDIPQATVDDAIRTALGTEKATTEAAKTGKAAALGSKAAATKANLLARGGNIAKGLGAGIAAEVAGRLISERLGGGNMSTNADPTGAVDAFGRGVAGGGTIGSVFGPVGAAVGGLGAGLGNAAGYTLTGGQGSLGNLPVIGGAFGGGTANRVRDIESTIGGDISKLSAEATKRKLDTYQLSPEARANVVKSYNAGIQSKMADGMAMEEAAAQQYVETFGGEADGKKIPGAIETMAAGTGETTSTGPSEQSLQQILALQQMVSQFAPQLGAPDLSVFNLVMNDAASNLAPELRYWAQSGQAEANRQAEVAGAMNQAYLASLPDLLTRQILQANQAAAEARALELQKAMLSSGGQNQDLAPA